MDIEKRLVKVANYAAFLKKSTELIRIWIRTGSTTAGIRDGKFIEERDYKYIDGVTFVILEESEVERYKEFIYRD